MRWLIVTRSEAPPADARVVVDHTRVVSSIGRVRLRTKHQPTSKTALMKLPLGGRKASACSVSSSHFFTTSKRLAQVRAQA